MKIIKRNGSEAVFDITKIISAITKANKVVPEAQRLTKQQIIEISDHVQEVCYNRGHAMNVEGDSGPCGGRHYGDRCLRGRAPLYHLSLCPEPQAHPQHDR